MKEVFAPHLNRNVKFGRRPRLVGVPTLHLRDFLAPERLPAIPAMMDWSKPAMPALHDVYGNDQLGDCVIAAGYHIEGVATANASGAPFHATSKQIVSDYSAIGGYVPGDPNTDQGCDLQTAFKYWMKSGFKNGTKLLGYVAINAADVATLKTALYLFENLDFGVGLPDKWISPFPSSDGFVWDAASPDENNGHSFPAYGYDASSVLIDSWGLLGHYTFKGIAATASASAGGEVYALLTPDILAKGQAKAPNGIAWADLVAAFDSMGGSVPVPHSPTNGVTLAEATAWAVTALAKGHAIKNKAQAEAEVTAGLAANWPVSS